MSQHNRKIIGSNDRCIFGTPSELAIKGLFYLQEIGMISCAPGFHSECDSIDSFLFLIVISGVGILNYNNNVYNLKPGCIVWIDCNLGYSYISSNEKPLLISWIHCNSFAMSKLCSFFNNKHDDILINVKKIQPFIDIFSNIKRIMSDKKTNYEYDVSLEIHALINMMTAFSQETDGISNAVSSIAEKGALIREYIEQNFNHKITLDDLSREFCVSKYYMLRSFKNQYGMTIIRYLQACRIQHAKKLLKFSDMQIEAIGRACGIDDVSYFNKLFRSYEGITAGEFRKKWKN